MAVNGVPGVSTSYFLTSRLMAIVRPLSWLPLILVTSLQLIRRSHGHVTDLRMSYRTLMGDTDSPNDGFHGDISLHSGSAWTVKYLESSPHHSLLRFLPRDCLRNTCCLVNSKTIVPISTHFCHYPADTWLSNNGIITSKRRRNVFLT